MAFTSPEQAKRYLHNGQMLTVVELARLAGCTKHAMRCRLARLDASAAVALGAKAPAKLPTDAWSRRRLLYPYQGRQATCSELAQLAGITRGAMRFRLMEMSAEQAVALGRNESKVRRQPPSGKRHPLGGKQVTLREAAEQTGISLRTLRERCKTRTLEQAVAMGQVNKTKAPKTWRNQHSQRKTVPRGPRSPFAPGAEAVTPEQLIPTTVAAPRGRFEVLPGEAPDTFRRLGPGHYEPTGTAIERAFGGKR